MNLGIYSYNYGDFLVDRAVIVPGAARGPIAATETAVFPSGRMGCADTSDCLLPQKSHGQMSSRPVVAKSGKFRVAKRPPLMRAMAAIIPSGAVMGRPCRSAMLIMSP